jgi:Universal stress protein family
MSIVPGYDESPGAHRALSLAIELAAKYADRLVLLYGVAPPGGVGDEFRAHQDALTEAGRNVDRARRRASA